MRCSAQRRGAECNQICGSPALRRSALARDEALSVTPIARKRAPTRCTVRRATNVVPRFQRRHCIEQAQPCASMRCSAQRRGA
ncbi:hypothetical protein D0A38_18630 [Xanthomonas campestris pv. incanae]|nr:hypothetical protein D0A38_18630 [Xanthomonas campestris pv. incanae]